MNLCHGIYMNLYGMTMRNGYEKITCDYYEKVGGGYQDGYEVFRAGYNAVQHSCEAVLDGHDEL